MAQQLGVHAVLTEYTEYLISDPRTHFGSRGSDAFFWTPYIHIYSHKHIPICKNNKKKILNKEKYTGWEEVWGWGTGAQPLFQKQRCTKFKTSLTIIV